MRKQQEPARRAHARIAPHGEGAPFLTSCGSGALGSSSDCGHIRPLLIAWPGLRLMEQATTSKPTIMYIFWPGANLTAAVAAAACLPRPPLICLPALPAFLPSFLSSARSRRPPACGRRFAHGVRAEDPKRFGQASLL